MREGKPLEPGWAMDSQGNPTTDATEAFNGLLVPIGNYKGVGISIMVDLLSSAISQSIAFSNEVKRVEDSEHPQNVSHIFIAFNISDMVDITLFKESIAKYTKTIKSVRRKEGCNEIFMPGEIEWRTECDRRKSGIVLSDKAVSQLNNFATQLGVSPLPIV
jgi:LDH2 family malate/lactate/ureidoglycolate dehydrogenase